MIPIKRQMSWALCKAEVQGSNEVYVKDSNFLNAYVCSFVIYTFYFHPGLMKQDIDL